MPHPVTVPLDTTTSAGVQQYACRNCDDCPGKHYICDSCGKATKKPDHMVSHLQMCRRKKALGGAAPDDEQAEARAAAGEQPAVRHRNSPHLGSQQYFGWVVKDENGTMSSWRPVTSRCPGSIYEPVGIPCCTWNLQGTTTCIVLTKTGPQVYNIPYFNTCTLQPILDLAHFAWLVRFSSALCLLSRLRVGWGQGFGCAVC